MLGLGPLDDHGGIVGALAVQLVEHAARLLEQVVGAHGIAGAQVHRGLIIEQPRGEDRLAGGHEPAGGVGERIEGALQRGDVAEVVADAGHELGDLGAQIERAVGADEVLGVIEALERALERELDAAAHPAPLHARGHGEHARVQHVAGARGRLALEQRERLIGDEQRPAAVAVRGDLAERREVLLDRALGQARLGEVVRGAGLVAPAGAEQALVLLGVEAHGGERGPGIERGRLRGAAVLGRRGGLARREALLGRRLEDLAVGERLVGRGIAQPRRDHDRARGRGVGRWIGGRGRGDGLPDRLAHGGRNRLRLGVVVRIRAGLRLGARRRVGQRRRLLGVG